MFQDVPTIFGKFLCQGDCLFFPVAASAKAPPAARDTMLVLDNSSSMNDLGNNRPMRDVKDAAELYVDEVEELIRSPWTGLVSSPSTVPALSALA
ncbi:MAG: hypothetical protein R2857_11145 [Vampirovibrionales bacterium]